MLWIKLFIVAIIITGFLVAALGLKMFFDSSAGSAVQSCHTGDENAGDENGCSHCGIKDIAKCDEKPVIHPAV